jgi:hypothetical protein
VQTQRLDKGGFTHPRHAADTQTKRVASVWQQCRQQRVRLRTMVGTCGFQQRDGFGQGAALAQHVAPQNAFQNGG